MQHAPPIRRDAPSRSWDRLISGVMLGRCEVRAFEVLVCGVAKEPILTRLEASDDGVTGRSCVSGRMLAGRVVTTSDMPALCTPAQVKPPTAGGQALDAACSTGWHVRSNRGFAHRARSPTVVEGLAIAPGRKGILTSSTVIPHSCGANTDRFGLVESVHRSTLSGTTSGLPRRRFGGRSSGGRPMVGAWKEVREVADHWTATRRPSLVQYCGDQNAECDEEIADSERSRADRSGKNEHHQRRSNKKRSHGNKRSLRGPMRVNPGGTVEQGDENETCCSEKRRTRGISEIDRRTDHPELCVSLEDDGAGQQNQRRNSETVAPTASLVPPANCFVFFTIHHGAPLGASAAVMRHRGDRGIETKSKWPLTRQRPCRPIGEQAGPWLR